MYKAFGIVNPCGKNIWVDGLQKHRPIGSFSFLGRYRVVDFPISNLSNSGIDRIQVYVGNKPRSIVEHIGTGRHYSINSKSGKVQILFSDDNVQNSLYNTDISAYLANLDYIERMHHDYVVITPSYMVYEQDFNALLNTHIESGADVTLLYHSVDNAKDHFLNCNILNLNKQKGVLSIETNHGNAKNRQIFMDTYIMKKDLLIELIHKAKKTSSMFTLADIVSEEAEAENLDIRGVAHRGFFASITDFKSFYDANMSLIDYKTAQTLFADNWPIYTRTNDSCPTRYFETADVKSSVVSNGCRIEGTVENSVIGRGCIIKKGAVVKNSVILAGTVIGENIKVENQVVDKGVKILKVPEVISPADQPGYVERHDSI